MTYNWQELKEGALEIVPSLNGRDNVVVAINYERAGTDDEGNQFVYSGQLVCPAPSPIEFTAFEDLKEENIFQWLNALVDTESIDSIIEQELLKTKTVSLPLPWADNN